MFIGPKIKITKISRSVLVINSIHSRSDEVPQPPCERPDSRFTCLGFRTFGSFVASWYSNSKPLSNLSFRPIRTIYFNFGYS